MIYVIGTNHELQHSGRIRRGQPDAVAAARSQFFDYLQVTAKRLHISLIAEELAPEVLCALSAQSLARLVAEAIGAEHRFCEPSIDDRAALGLLPVGTEDLTDEQRSCAISKREWFWLSRMRADLHKSILFICGAAHVDSFADLLRIDKVAVEIIEPYFGRAAYEP